MSKRRRAAEALRPILEAGKSLRVADLAEELISAMGGTAKFAQIYAEEVNRGTKPGSVARARMLDGIVRVVTNASAQNKNVDRTEDQFSDEELHRIVEDYLHDPLAAEVGGA